MKKLFWMMAVVSMLFSVQSFASDMKVAVVDIKTAMENTKAYASGIKRLEALQNKKKKELESLRKRLTDLDKELQLQAMTMSTETQNAKQQELGELKKKFDRKLQDASDELKGEKRKLDSRMIAKFYDAVRAYGKDKKFDLILPKSTVMYAGAGLDITADITKIMDKK